MLGSILLMLSAATVRHLLVAATSDSVRGNNVAPPAPRARSPAVRRRPPARRPSPFVRRGGCFASPGQRHVPPARNPFQQPPPTVRQENDEVMKRKGGGLLADDRHAETIAARHRADSFLGRWRVARVRLLSRNCSARLRSARMACESAARRCTPFNDSKVTGEPDERTRGHGYEEEDKPMTACVGAPTGHEGRGHREPRCSWILVLVRIDTRSDSAI